MTIYRSAEGHAQIRDWCERHLSDWEHAYQRSILETDLGRTHVVTSGTGPPVVLLPGTNFASTSWLELVAAMSVQHTVHAVDLPGQPGLSSPVRPGRGPDRYARWLAELLPRLGDAPLTLVGHSLGASFALGAASRSTSVARLLLLDPAGIRRLSVSPTVIRPAIGWTRKPGPRTSQALLHMMSAPGAVPDPDQVGWMTLVGRHVRTSLAPSPLPMAELARLRDLPTTVLSGRHDAFLPPDRLVGSVRLRLPAATVRIVERAGHLLPHEQPELVVEELEAMTSGRS